ncbi:DNA cytosine methyltransferase [Streptomyces sp. MNU89]|uniref:DNA cytosine methyltransferase n=1 Tax=Streptomyces sp. MNU89 TaxID=2560025 RepID=UPI001E5A7E3D|nr:DNA cytosine methyltransferase [Streptomyces sp. MNU89]MCC9741305.1 DNA cytosine methyltransferase [Streptomyces sp. MNU89]
MHSTKIVDLFAGPGGLDVAAQRLGIPVVGIEWDKDACETRRAAKLSTVEGDVRDFRPATRHSPEVEDKLASELEHIRTANVLAGGPPCQTYTVAGNGAGRKALDHVLMLVKRMTDRDKTVRLDILGEDERTGLVLEPLYWALAAIDAGHAYDTIVLEQVPAALRVWEAMGEALAGERYQVAHGILRTEQFGVPQTRRRAVLIARRNGVAALPEPTHRPYRKGVRREDGDPNLLPWVTMENALEREKPYVVISNYGTGGDPKARGRRRFFEPSATVTGKISRNRVVTPRGTERFTVAEAGQLQTFPAEYRWRGRAIAQQIGNAIPPRLGIHILAAALGIDRENRDRALESLDNDTLRGRREPAISEVARDFHQPELA